MLDDRQKNRMREAGQRDSGFPAQRASFYSRLPSEASHSLLAKRSANKV